MKYHRGVSVQQGAGLGSIFSGLFRSLIPVAKGAAKTVGKIVKNNKVRSAGKYLAKEATRASIDTALEALDGKPVGNAAKKRLKNATRNILQSAKNINTGAAARKRKNKPVINTYNKRRRSKQKPLFDDYEDEDDSDEDY